jgi:P27 family predicted phage terminase small subunit
MGRRKTPNAVLEKRGSKKTREEIAPPEGEVIPTRSLSPQARKAWDRVCAELKILGVLSPAYAEVITMAACSLGNAEVASDDINERGQISITERGETKNPSCTMLATMDAAAHRYLSSLGLTPTTIGNLIGRKKEESNPFADL